MHIVSPVRLQLISSKAVIARLSAQQQCARDAVCCSVDSWQFLSLRAPCVVLLQITPAQVNFLKVLNVPSTEYAHLTKTQATALISEKVEAKKLAPPTEPQMKMLKV